MIGGRGQAKKIMIIHFGPSISFELINVAQKQCFLRLYEKPCTAKKIYGELEFFSSINEIFVDVEAQF